MALDMKGAVKDNQKLLLGAVGIVVMAVMIAMRGGISGGIGLEGETGGTGPSQSGNPDVVNNGKNDMYKEAGAPAYFLQSGVDYKANIVTNKGIITVDLYERDTPFSVNNFVFLADAGFYNGTSFHRIDDDFVIQGGDPLGNSKGGPGYFIDDEIVSSLNFEPYVLAMANEGADTNGSQFFITTRLSNTAHLKGAYTIFGRVVDGFNVVDSIEEVEVVSSGTFKEMPYDPININSVRILKD